MLQLTLRKRENIVISVGGKVVCTLKWAGKVNQPRIAFEADDTVEILRVPNEKCAPGY